MGLKMTGGSQGNKKFLIFKRKGLAGIWHAFADAIDTG
jgi:hypothetical protein